MRLPGKKLSAYSQWLFVFLMMSCSLVNHSETAKETSVPSGSRMSPRPSRFGIKVQNNLLRSMAVATEIDPKTDTTIATRYDTVFNNLSTNGGKETSGTMLQAATDLAAAFAFKLVESESAKPLSERRVLPIDLNSGFTSGNRDLFSEAIQEGLIQAMVSQLTGAAPKPQEVVALKEAIRAMRPTMNNSAQGKQLLVAMLATIVLSANYYH